MEPINKIVDNALFYIGPNGISEDEKKLNHVICIASAIVSMVCILKIFATLGHLSILSTLSLTVLGMIGVDISKLTRFKATGSIFRRSAFLLQKGFSETSFVDKTFFTYHFIGFINPIGRDFCSE